MDAKVLRAAVSAAIRVTVSTALIGCGGTVTSGEGKSLREGAEAASRTSGSTTAPSNGEQPSGGHTSSGGSAVLAGGIASLGGSAEEGGSEGGESNAVTASLDTCDALNTCLTHIEASMPAAPLHDADEACCRAMIDDLKAHQVAVADACWADLNGRLMSSPARALCCNSPETWQVSACTPWGPPVPPELPEAALATWELAA
ncbi:MAG TPA: hypothetical protein VHB79_34495 [Polyangiaceae bacterium]|nr:hypothetical protein [Polyangiaceae bacterium]